MPRKKIPPEKKGIRSDSKYDHNMPEKLMVYFMSIQPSEEYEDEKGKVHIKYNTPPTKAGFCSVVKISESTFNNWRKEYPAFAEAYEICKAHAKHIWFENSMKGAFNPAFAIFYGKAVLGLSDKPEITTVKNINIDVAKDADKLRKMSDKELKALAEKYKLL